MKNSNKKIIKVMSSLFLAVCLTFSVGAFAGSNSKASAPTNGSTVTLKGEILDMQCYMTKGAHGPSHAECAENCLKDGKSMGLLAKDGTVYLIVRSNSSPKIYEKLKSKAAKQLAVTGKYFDRNGMKGIEVTSFK